MCIKDGIIGLVIGDALGVPVEFESRENLKNNPVNDMIGFGIYNMPPGTFSDDSSMTLATMRAIVNNHGEIFHSAILDEFVEWFVNSKYTQYNNTFDIGNTTRNCLLKYIDGGNPFDCGGTDERSNGNGSLMRILPLAFIKNINPETVENVSALTHSHLRSKIACVFYIELIKSILESKQDLKEHVKIASKKTRKYYVDIAELNHYKRVFDGTIFDEIVDNVPSSGYVVDTLEAVVYVLGNTNSFKEAVLTAVNLGGDSDTIGAIVGGVAGVYYGYDEIPQDWIEEIEHVDKIINCVMSLRHFQTLFKKLVSVV